MPNLLHLDSSADLAHSRSRALTAAFAEAWTARGPEYTVTRRDLHVDQLPHLEASALHWPESARQPGASIPDGAEALQQEVIDELLGADVLLVGSPLYNYTVASTLKAWIDRVHVPGVLAPAEPGDVQPLAGRPAVTVVSRGGSYDAGTPSEHWDHGSPVLQLILGTALGMDVHPVTTSLTLADVLPGLAEFSERSHDEFEAARAELVGLARTL
ncbi:FMN-dependent NADH-azoreductase [Curtobacterium sp. Leaf261]|uniref:FMN-dependent NADH-azoreductase n=1 Tax=Curtobacterium sp. Leaf261 TaxID=1736311 RepID=UPI0006F2182D|nr:NAD(P)H-dependent oxidoreductase [Curtobacterium sp. Leaf261]KQO65129.1 FMN-dependent NADH-azoreductase [Curtobacterium sp. Leaf261]